MKILVAEDDHLHRAFLVAVLRKALPKADKIVEVADGAQAIEAIERDDFSAAVLDLQMPHVSGVESAKRIWKATPDARILFWSNYSDEAYVRGVSRIVPDGAAYGYLLKSVSEERLELAMRAVFLQDQCVIDREVRGIQQRTQNLREGLTDSEIEVLTDIALGLTDKAIAARRHISTRGVQSRLKHLYEKLGVDQKENSPQFGPLFNSRTRAVAVAMERGLLNVEGMLACQIELNDWMRSDLERP